MTNPLKTESARSIGLLLARLPLGVVFFWAGLNKVRMGVTHFVSGSSKFIPDYLPRPIGQTYLYAVPFVELIIGALLVLGLFTRTTATITALMLLSYILAVTGLVDANTHVLHFNATDLGLAILLMVSGAGGISVDRAAFKEP